jgi:hypothetical protein
MSTWNKESFFIRLNYSKLMRKQRFVQNPDVWQDAGLCHKLAIRYKTIRVAELNPDGCVHKCIAGKADAVSLSGYTTVTLAS